MRGGCGASDGQRLEQVGAWERGSVPSQLNAGSSGKLWHCKAKGLPKTQPGEDKRGAHRCPHSWC